MLSGHDTPVNSPRLVNMRKRKRSAAYGSYVDEDTGEVSTVQTSKQVKRAHQKSGKWYKEPTEAELRAWERDEKKQAQADRAARREENKKLNAVKRVEKERKEEEAKRQMYHAGKITFTQTLAKKDEDQMNLHSWFGGRPAGAQRLKTSLLANSVSAASGHKEDPADHSQDQCDGNNAPDHSPASQASEDGQMNGEVSEGQLNQQSQRQSRSPDKQLAAKDIHNKHFSLSDPRPPQMADRVNDSSTIDLATDLVMDQDHDVDFEVLEDDSAETSVLDPYTDVKKSHQFKVPPLPNAHRSPQRLPLSPMSPSDVNVRNSQTTLKVSSFKSRLEDANIEVAPSTQTVRDILSGICTQDLADDLDDFGKENEAPDFGSETSTAASPTKLDKHSSLTKFAQSARSEHATDKTTMSFDSIADSVDYDSIFFEIDAAEKADVETADEMADEDNFDDYDLDDSTLLSLPPATQLISSAQKLVPPITSTSTITYLPMNPPDDIHSPTKPKRSLTKAESFALEGLDEEDLLAQVNELERSQLEHNTSTLSFTSRRRRVLPWNRPSWSAEVERTEQSFGEAVGNDDDGDVEMTTQDTEIISSFGE